MTYAALSCFQGRTQDAAWDALLPWVGNGIDGIQLTPGCLPSPSFRERVAVSGVPVRRHHGFAWGRYRREVWVRDAPAFADSERSVHPTHEGSLERVLEADFIFETMYPGEALGTDPELERAMGMGVRLAVDVSHVHIARVQGALSDAVLARLLEYPGVMEIHVSENDGSRDQHRLVARAGALIDWALRHPAPKVYEAYLHRVDEAGIAAQWGLLNG